MWYPEVSEEVIPKCPVCGQRCEEIVLDSNNEVAGCENCTRTRDAWEWLNEVIENDRIAAQEMAAEAYADMVS